MGKFIKVEHVLGDKTVIQVDWNRSNETSGQRALCRPYKFRRLKNLDFIHQSLCGAAKKSVLKHRPDQGTDMLRPTL